jgi:hypothetical protein
VKCPSISYHLTGAKKVQQELATPGTVERFLAPSEAAAVRRCFAGQFTLSGEALALATTDPDAAVRSERASNDDDDARSGCQPLPAARRLTGGLWPDG